MSGSARDQFIDVLRSRGMIRPGEEWVIDANLAALASGAATGIQFIGGDYYALAAAITRAVGLYHHPETWRRIQKTGMKADFSWARRGAAYAKLYHRLVQESQ